MISFNYKEDVVSFGLNLYGYYVSRVNDFLDGKLSKEQVKDEANCCLESIKHYRERHEIGRVGNEMLSNLEMRFTDLEKGILQSPMLEKVYNV